MTVHETLVTYINSEQRVGQQAKYLVVIHTKNTAPHDAPSLVIHITELHFGVVVLRAQQALDTLLQIQRIFRSARAERHPVVIGSNVVALGFVKQSERHIGIGDLV